METKKEIDFLTNPHINGKKLNYVEPVNIYANLFEIKLTKELQLYQYPYEVKPKIEEGNIYIRQKLFKNRYKEIKEKYGFFFISGDSLYSLNKVENITIFKSILRLKKEKIEYSVEIGKYENKKIIKEEDISKDPLSKQFIELMIKDILLTNPNVECFKDTYIMVNKGEEIDINEFSSFTFYPG